MTFNAELCNYTLSFVRAVNRIEPGQIAQSLLTSNGYLIIQNIFISTSWTGNTSHQFLKKKETKACQNNQRYHVMQ